MSRHQVIASRVRSLPLSPIRKFFDLVSSMPEAISLSIGEPDFVTPWHIREAAIFSIERGHTHYTPNRGLEELREEVSAYLHRRFGLSYCPESEVLITVGVSQGLDLAFRALLGPGDRAIVPEPCYVSYKPGVMLAAGEPLMVPTLPGDGFRVRAEQVEEAAGLGAKVLVLGYPNNPTGAALEASDLEAIASVVSRKGLLVISDEIYAELTYDGDHISIASLPGMKERTVLLGGFSKAFAMTGWRLGYACGEAEILGAMTNIHAYMMLSAPTLAQKAAAEALRSGQAEVERMRQEYNRRRRLMVSGLNEIGLPCLEPKGAFYAFPSISGTGLDSEEFSRRLLMEEKVAVVPGNAFGESGEGHVRCSYATSIAQIEEALARMERFLKRV